MVETQWSEGLEAAPYAELMTASGLHGMGSLGYRRETDR